MRGARLAAPAGGRSYHDWVGPTDVTIDGGRIAEIAASGGTAMQHDARSIGDIDAQGLLLAPGFVDLQVNGGFGLDLQRDPFSVWDLGRRLPSTGVTAFLPTIISSPPSVTDALLAALRQRPADYAGAEPLGAHFEGPMLNPDRSGAHQRANIVAADAAVYEGWTAAAGVAMVTLAPEIPGAIDAIEHLSANGVVVSAGHSGADANETRRSIDAGVTAVTHLFNAMARFDHRAPNLVGVALTDDRVTATVIVDGQHLDATAVKLAWSLKGPERFVLITDAVSALGLPPGTYQFAGGPVVADEHRVFNVSGGLAGSNLAMHRAVRNLGEFTGCDTAEAVAAASTTPARLLGRRDRGRLAVGSVADVVLADANFDVAVTVCGGQLAYVAPEHRHRAAALLAP